MFQTDQPTASNTLPAPAAAGTQGYFTNGNPASGVAATILDADWLNMVQQELLNVVTAAGETPSKTTYNQVMLAIKRLVQAQVVLTDTGAANAYSVTNNPPLTATTWANGVVQQFVVAHTNSGASTFVPDGLTTIPIYGLGLQPLQGNEMFAGGTAILMKQTITGVNSGNPIAVLLECSGGAQQIPPATASGHAVQLGQVTSASSPLQLTTQPATSANQAVQYGQSFGLGQTFQDVTASRVIGTTYTNTTGKPIFVYLTGTLTTTTGSVAFYVNGVFANLSYQQATGTIVAASTLVPPGATYAGYFNNVSVNAWREYR